MRILAKAGAVAVSLSAGLALTACGPSSGTTSSASSSAPAGATVAATDGSSGSTGTTGSGSSGGGVTGGTAVKAGVAVCRTANLSFAYHGGSDPGTVTMKNTGSKRCTMHGYPGADVKDTMGDSVSLTRDKSVTPKDITLSPGGEASFLVTWPINNSGGSGITFTTLVVTPPNETHSVTLKVGINIAIGDGSTTGKPITVSPVSLPS